MKLYLNSLHIANMPVFKLHDGQKYLAILENVSVEARGGRIIVVPNYMAVVEVYKTSTTAVIIHLRKLTIILNFRRRKVEVKIEHSLPDTN